MSVLTPEQRAVYEADGCVTIDTPLTPEQLAAARDALNRLLPPASAGHARVARTCDFDDAAIVDILQHPFFEAIAQETLNADAVWFYQSAILNAYPEPGKPWSFEEHVDIEYCQSDWDATPRKVICSFFLWLTDVNEKRAPMMLRPGTHRPLAKLREDDPATRGVDIAVAPKRADRLPALDPMPEPVKLTARAGQVSVLTTAAIHGASVNVDDQPRQNLVLTFVAKGQEIGLPPDQEAQKREIDRKLCAAFRPERRHLIAPG